MSALFYAFAPIFTLGVATLFMSACFGLLSPIEPETNARLGQGPVLFAVQFAAGFLIRYGFVVPFVMGAGLAALGAFLVYSQVEAQAGGAQAGGVRVS